jgi:hypothetical protein
LFVLSLLLLLFLGGLGFLLRVRFLLCETVFFWGAWDMLALLCFGSGLPASDRYFFCMGRLGWRCDDISILHLVA